MTTNIDRAAEIIAQEWATFSTRDLCGHEIGIARALHRAGMLMPDGMGIQTETAALLDTPDAVPPNTLTVGSVWNSSYALAQACVESGYDRIVVSNQGGYVFAWDKKVGWWEGSASPRFAPYTILHIGKKADQ